MLKWRIPECKGEPALLANIGPGHEIIVVTADKQKIAICTKCAAYGSRKTVLLSNACQEDKGTKPNRYRALKRARNGFHPNDKFLHMRLDDV